MKKLLVLTLCMLTLLTGCGNTASPESGETTGTPESGEASGTPTEILPEDTPPVAETTDAASEELLHVTVETVEISVDTLKEQDYTVPVMVTLDKNPGITYFEWGLNIDSKCTFTATSDGLPFNTVSALNEENHFLWTAWISTTNVESTGEMLQVDVKLPMDAAPGSTYPITYADTSFADKPHVWSNSDNDYVAAAQVGWTDGGITVTE